MTIENPTPEEFAERAVIVIKDYLESPQFLARKPIRQRILH